MNKTKSGNNNRPRRSVSFLTRLRPDNLVPNKRPQQQQQGDPLEWPDTKSVLGLENEQLPPTKSNSFRRDSLGNIQHFLRTLAYWKRHRSAQPSTDSTTVSSVGVSCNKSEKPPRPVERSKSFSIKCDKGYATYYQIEPKKKHAESDTSSLLLLPEQKISRNITNNNNNNNNRCNPFSNFHEVGLPLPPPVKRPLRRSASSLSHYTGSSAATHRMMMMSSPAPRCDVIRLGSIPENNSQMRIENNVGHIAIGAAPAPVLTPPNSQGSLSLVVPPVKKLVSAYNEQMLRRQHNSAYASLCRVVTSPAQGPPTGLTAHGSLPAHGCPPAQLGGPPRAQAVVQATAEPIYVNIYAASNSPKHDSYWNFVIITSSKIKMEAPPRPPKKDHMQNRKLSPSSIERIQRRQSLTGKHAKYKPPAPDPDPAPPDLQVTNEWIKQVLSGSNKSGHAAIDCSDSGCSSLGSTTTSPMTSGICTTRLDSQGSPNLLVPMCSPPDLLLWNQSVPDKNSPAAMVAQIEQKLQNYNSQKLDIEEAIRNNDALGQGITSLVETRATPREISKFKFHVEDTEKITNLLVSLSGRLARTEHALASSDYSLESEKANLISKRGKLQDQLNEAKFLQENIQKRSGVVSSYLQKYFSPSEFEEFERFLDRKSKNIMEIRELSDKIALSEEQMRVLTKSV